MEIKIIQSFLTQNRCYKANKKIKIEGLMLHSVGCPQPNANVFIKKWNNEEVKKAVHAFIDGNTGEVYQTLPWDHRGWHCGGDANNTHIGVEMCEPASIKYVKGSKFECINKQQAIQVAQRTWESAIELFAFLCEKYDLNPLTDIISHKEGSEKGIASNHTDPSHIWEQLGLSYTMDKFREAVKDKMERKSFIKPIKNYLKGANTEEKIWNFLYDKIKNPFSVAGIMGNLFAESGLKPNNLQNSYNKKFNMSDEEYTAKVNNLTYDNFIKDSAGYGLAQWTYWSRKENLYNNTVKKGYSIDSLQGQLEFLMIEFNQEYRKMFGILKDAKDVETASNIILTQFEKPRNQSEKVKQERLKYSMSFFNKFATNVIDVYEIILGKYKFRINAVITLNNIKRYGFSGNIIRENSFYKIRLQGLHSKEEVQRIQAKLKKYNHIADIEVNKK